MRVETLQITEWTTIICYCARDKNWKYISAQQVAQYYWVTNYKNLVLANENTEDRLNGHRLEECVELYYRPSGKYPIILWLKNSFIFL